jgi:uncharacterized membrane protein
MMASLGILLVPIVSAVFKSRSWPVAVLLGLIIGVFLLLLTLGHATALALYLPPVVINFALAWLFGHTLLRGRVPLVERLVRVLHAGEERIDPAIIQYAGRVTLAWALLLALLGATNLVLATCVVPGGFLQTFGIQPPIEVPQESWSFVANIGSYIVVGAFFAMEYLYRRRRFPEQPYRNAADFLGKAIAAGPQIMASFRD